MKKILSCLTLLFSLAITANAMAFCQNIEGQWIIPSNDNHRYLLTLQNNSAILEDETGNALFVGSYECWTTYKGSYVTIYRFDSGIDFSNGIPASPDEILPDDNKLIVAWCHRTIYSMKCSVGAPTLELLPANY